MFRVFLILSVLIYCAAGASLRDDNDLADLDDLIVEIKNGKIQGERFVSADENKFPYIGFLGIPFAEPPVGEFRFQPPQPKKNWDGILKTTQEAPMCMQPFANSSTLMSEDCLYLNVYTPDLGASYPVMVYIYGGFFLVGTAAKSAFGPDYLIQEGVVVVTVNYRVGVFGFLSTEDQVAPGNYGLKDQIFGLKWVQENIRAFGGDPDQVTLFGESAGSASVSLLLQAKSTIGLFHGAIMESGVSMSLFARTREPRNLAFTTGELLGILTNDTQDLVTKMRNVSADTLLGVSFTNDIITTALTNPRDGLLFAPCIEVPNSEAAITEYSYEQLQNGDFNIVPVIVGYNSGEGNPFESGLILLPLFLLKYDLDPSLVVPIDMNIEDDVLKTEIGIKIKAHYFGDGIISQPGPLSKFLSDDQFIRPTNEFVRLISKYTPTYYYQFSYAGDIPGSIRSLPGVGHGEDVQYLWNTGTDIGEGDKATRVKLVKMWTNFAKFRNPTPDIDAQLDNVTWTPSNSQDFPYLEIGEKMSVDNNPHGKHMSFWNDLYQMYGNPPYDTY